MIGDVVFVVATFVFFGICVAYVQWCDRIVGPDEFAPEVTTTAGEFVETAADAEVTA